MKSLTIIKPDDWHVHLRDGDQLTDTLTATASNFARALIMPNLKPPLTSVAMINDYRQRIVELLADKKLNFTPYLTFYLNESIETHELLLAKQYPYILGAKLYPAGCTTNAEAGTKSINSIYPLLSVMQEQDLVLQIHGEENSGDIFFREKLFIENHLIPIVKNFPKLRIVLEHISTRAAVEFITNSTDNIAATITAHHLIYNRNDLFKDGIRPHFYCLPILKSEQDQKALQEAATSGNPKFFAGTDSAPHLKNLKESACGCAGIYSAPFAISIYTECFENLNKLDKLNYFLGKFGADFYKQKINAEQIELIKNKQTVPLQLPLGHDYVVPIEAGKTLAWSIHGEK